MIPNSPSFYAHILNGLCILFALILVYKNFRSIKQLDVSRKLILLLLFAIVFGVHSLSHLGLEFVYHFNPLSN